MIKERERLKTVPCFFSLAFRIFLLYNLFEINSRMLFMKTEINVIAHIHTDFSSKFGIPRQSGLVEELEATIVFEP